MSPTIRPLRRGTVLAAVIATVALMSGCGDDDGGGGSVAGVHRLSESEAEKALLTADNLGEGFKLSKDDDEDDAPGCLDDFDDVEDAPTDEEREFETTEEDAFLSVGSFVSSYDKVADAIDSFERVRDAVSDCTEVDETDEDGYRTQLKIELDDERSTTTGDEQVNVVATGTIEGEGLEFPIVVRISAVRLGNHVVGITYGSLEEEDEAVLDVDAYVTAAVARLVAVTEGENPSDDLIEAVTAEGDDGDGDSPSSSMLPLDGGSYTWENGVTMTLSVQRVERWGDTDDFCGDGSCGIANPDDTRFVLRYEVSVPDDFDGPFDPSSCPGELHVKEGNDDDAFSGVAGDYDKSLDGKIFPGLTKFGVDEYYIEKAYADKEFYLESTCGDVDYDGESAFFEGPVKKVA